jgi:hypothetical protein
MAITQNSQATESVLQSLKTSDVIESYYRLLEYSTGWRCAAFLAGDVRTLRNESLAQDFVPAHLQCHLRFSFFFFNFTSLQTAGDQIFC